MSKQAIKYRYAYALAIIIGMLLVLQQYAEHVFQGYDFEFSWLTVSLKVIPGLLLWAAISPWHNRLIKPLANESKKWLNPIAKLLVISLLVALAHRVVSIRLFDGLTYIKTGAIRGFFSQYSMVLLVAGFFSSFLQFWMISGLFFALNYYHKFLEKQRALNQAELSALRMQLQPHFLFNTLNSISSLIDIDRKMAQKMLSQLGFLLRKTLEQGNEPMILLKDELSYVQNYLAIEHIRFQDRLVVTYEVMDELEEVRVPCLILQPIAENAIKHGISNIMDDGKITISCKLLSDIKCVEVVVENSGDRHLKKHTQGYGIGIQNIKKRLEQLYGDAYQFEYGWLDDDCYQTKIIIPVR